LTTARQYHREGFGKRFAHQGCSTSEELRTNGLGRLTGQSAYRSLSEFRRQTLIAEATIPMERAGIIELWSMPGKRFFPGMGIHWTVADIMVPTPQQKP
jgi:hypothetical protein